MRIEKVVCLIILVAFLLNCGKGNDKYHVMSSAQPLPTVTVKEKKETQPEVLQSVKWKDELSDDVIEARTVRRKLSEFNEHHLVIENVTSGNILLNKEIDIPYYLQLGDFSIDLKKAIILASSAGSNDVFQLFVTNNKEAKQIFSESFADNFILLPNFNEENGKDIVLWVRSYKDNKAYPTYFEQVGEKYELRGTCNYKDLKTKMCEITKLNSTKE